MVTVVCGLLTSNRLCVMAALLDADADVDVDVDVDDGGMAEALRLERCRG